MAAPLAAQNPLSVAVGPSLAGLQLELQEALGGRFKVVELLAMPPGGEDVSVLGTSELPAGQAQLIRPRGRLGVVLVGLGAGPDGAAGIPWPLATIVEALSGLAAPVSAPAATAAPAAPLAQAS